MKNLKILQNQFIDGIFKESDKILSSILEKNIDVNERLDIYRNNVYGALSNALRITFSHVFAVLKEKKFNKIAYEYIDKNRSNSGNMDDYGAGFPDFLQNKNEFLADLARLDWLFLQAYLAKNETEIDLPYLQKLSPEKLGDIKFRITKSLYFLDSDFNLLKINNRKKHKNKLHFIIYRSGNEVVIEKISKKEIYFLNLVRQDLTMFEVYKKCGFAIDKYLQKFIQNRILLI